MYKNLILTGTFLLSFVATIGGLIGIEAFERIKIEGVGLTIFEFMIYFTILATGIFGLLASRQTLTLRKVSQYIMVGGINSIYSTASGIIGWVLGLVTYAAFIGSWIDVYKGLLIAFFLIIFALSPIKWSNEVKNISDEKIAFSNRDIKHPRVFIMVNIILILLGIYGFYTMLKGS